MSKKKVINELVGKNIQYLIDSDPNENTRKLSDALDVDRRTVSRWTNENIFPEEHVLAIADYFGVSLDQLLNTDLSMGRNQEGAEHIKTLRNNIEAMNSNSNNRIDFNNYLRSLGVVIAFEHDKIEGTELHTLHPVRVRLSLNGKESIMKFSEYEDLKNRINADTLKMLHLD